MTIDEAMTDLSIQLEVKSRFGNQLSADALKLGIEALKRHQKRAYITFSGMMEPLPGEDPK